MGKLLVDIEDEILEKLDKVAPDRSERRSEFVTLALRRALWELEEQQTAHRASSLRYEQKVSLLNEINEAWADGLDGEERAVMRGMQKKYRKAVKDSW